MPAKVKVRLFHELRANLGESEIELEADTMRELLDTLITKNGSFRDLVYDSRGQLHGYILFYLNNSLQNPPDMSRKLNDGDLVLLIPPAAGG